MALSALAQKTFVPFFSLDAISVCHAMSASQIYYKYLVHLHRRLRGGAF